MVQEPQDQPRPTQSSVRCAHCGYSMDALPASAVCPECGGSGRVTWRNGVPVTDGRFGDIGLLYRPVIRAGACCAVLCVVSTAVAMRLPRGHVVGGVASVLLVLAGVVLVLVAPIWAGAISARRSHHVWGSRTDGAMVRHISDAIGTALVTGTLGFGVGIVACLLVPLLSIMCFP